MIIGMTETTASKQAFLIGAYVLIVPFLGWVINNKKPGVFAAIGAIMAVIGIGLLTINDSFSIGMGDVISIISSFFFAIHMILIERYSKECDPIVSTIIQFGLTSIIFVVLTFLFESFSMKPDTHSIFGLVYIVVFSTVVAFLVQNIAQKYLSASSTALILSMETAFGGIFSVLLLHDRITIRMLIGGIIILLGIVTEETKWNFYHFKRGGNKIEKPN